MFTSEAERYPEKGWLTGSCDDLASYIESSMLSHSSVEETTTRLQEAVARIASNLRSHLQTNDKSEVLDQIAAELHQEDGEADYTHGSSYTLKCRRISRVYLLEQWA